MRFMGVNEIREAYLAFFESKGHLRLPSFSLVPENDPSLLLINAGMTPMKPWFRGTQIPPRRRVTTCQKCIRTPDIDRVGHTARHGTFFEMLGNFSFGDYFKAEVIPWAWSFVTEVLGMEPERVYVSVYQEDDEAYQIWHEVVGLPEDHIVRLGKEDNFWEHGTGPCGPCSEIFYDRGEAYDIPGLEQYPGSEGDRYIEFWNLVFTQFDRQEDGSYLPLKQRNIDTGAGLERIACLMQGVDNLFEVDTIRDILNLVCEIAGVNYGDDPKTDVAIRVVTDHIRSTTMMISDGILPSNEGRGYVLRRLLRRAARYGRLLGVERLFLGEVAQRVIQHSKGAYPELAEREAYILGVIEREEGRFARTIAQGMRRLNGQMELARSEGRTQLTGAEVFRLHDTDGFPLDLTREIAAEAGFSVDEAGFQEEMAKQRQQAREALLAKGGSAWAHAALPIEIEALPATKFVGYKQLTAKAQVLGLVIQEGEGEETELLAVDLVSAGTPAILITDVSPCYARAGGQVGDIGLFEAEGVSGEIVDTTKTANGVYLHQVIIHNGTLQKGANLRLEVNADRRQATARNHTATHLLHKALRTVIGDEVSQAGSEVRPDGLRFDFSCSRPMSREEIKEVERLVNEAILADLPICVRELSLEQARSEGAMALFSEKYGDVVRVLSVGGTLTADGCVEEPFSLELCGGTHLERSSQACCFAICSEASIASGVRRIEAVTGAEAMKRAQQHEEELQNLARQLKVEPAQTLDKIRQLQEELRQVQRRAEDLERQLAQAQLADVEQSVETIGSYQVLVQTVPSMTADALRDSAAQLRDRFAPAVVVLAMEQEGRLQFVAMASPEAVKAGAHCGQMVKAAALAAGGGGGGRPDMAQAGAKDSSQLQAALTAAREAIKGQLG